MGKHEKGSAKDIANRSKAKGLQKLAFYCQMCQKQCRDANGFKCHQTSAGHLRMMGILREDTAGIVNDFSQGKEREAKGSQALRHGGANRLEDFFADLRRLFFSRKERAACRR